MSFTYVTEIPIENHHACSIANKVMFITYFMITLTNANRIQTPYGLDDMHIVRVFIMTELIS